MKKICLIIILCLTLTLSGCGREEKYPDALTVGSEDVPKTLNPYSSADSANLYIIGQIYNSLLGTHVTPLDYVENEVYTFEDGSVYTPIDINENYYYFEDGLVKKEGAYPKKPGSIYGFEYYTPSNEEYEKQLVKKKIVFGKDELGNNLVETQEQFEKRREEAVPSDNWMKYRFEVDTRYTWNDGEDFTADDIVFTFKYALKYSGQLGSLAMFLNNYINCYSDNGDFVLELASNKLSDIKTICNSIFIIPEHIWNSVSDPDSFNNTTNPVGTNAYKLASGGFIQDASVCLEFREDFNEELTKQKFAYEPIKNIFMVKMANEEIMLNALNQGDIDTTLNSFSASKIYSINNSNSYKNINIAISPSSFITTLVTNVGENGVFKDLPDYVREAISLSIDQEALIDDYLYGDGSTVGGGLVIKDSVHALTDEEGNYVNHETNIEKANELLDEEYPLVNGKRNLSFSILGPTSNEVLINTIATQLKNNLGIEVSFKLSTGSEYSEIIKQSNGADFDMIINSVTFEIDKLLMFDARFGVYSTGSPRVWNFSGINNPELSSLMNQMDTAKTNAEQLAYCYDVQRMISELNVEIPLYSSLVYSVYQEQKFSGWVQTSTGSILNTYSMKYLQLK